MLAVSLCKIAVSIAALFLAPWVDLVASTSISACMLSFLHRLCCFSALHCSYNKLQHGGYAPRTLCIMHFPKVLHSSQLCKWHQGHVCFSVHAVYAQALSHSQSLPTDRPFANSRNITFTMQARDCVGTSPKDIARKHNHTAAVELLCAVAANRAMGNTQSHAQHVVS